MKKIITGFLLLFSIVVIAQKKYPDGLYAALDTDKGLIVVQLTYDKTPATVANFVSLAEGTNESVDAKFKGKKFFDGLKFHRVIADFMIQGGDPDGTGGGNPGYLFHDEIVPELKHDKAGTLSMANRGPATNGSQFFITHKETPWLDGKHTVFGYVIEGQNVVDKITQNDKIKKVTIIREGKEAKKFDAPKVFKNAVEKNKKDAETAKLKAEKLQKETEKYFAEIRSKAIQTNSGLAFYIYEKGNQGQGKPNKGEEVKIDYAGYLENGKIFDTSNEDTATKYLILDQQRKAANAYKPINFMYGNKDGLIKGFIEGLENMNYGDKALIFIPAELGYGERGIGPIPAHSNLVFDLHLTK